MNHITGTRTLSTDLRQFTRTIAELYHESTPEVLAKTKSNWDPVREKIQRRRQGVEYFEDSSSRCRTNPFDGSLVLYEIMSSRLTVLLHLSKPLRVIAEIYTVEGTFLKRIFDRQICHGATEIISIGSQQFFGEYVMVLHSCEGIISFRIRMI